MSWSVAFVGKPEAIANALETYSEKLEGASRDEYDASKGALITLCKNNFCTEESGYTQPLMRLDASGGGYSSLTRNVQVTLTLIYGEVVQ